MIVTLTPNPAIDLTYRVDRLHVGEYARVDAPARRAGGKGVNTAAVLTLMGVPALSVVHLDAAAASWWGAQLEERGIGSRVVVVGDPYRTRASVAVVDDQGAATVLNEAGAAPPPQVWRALSGLVLEQLEHPADPGSRHVLALCGSLPEGLAPAAVGALVAEAGRRSSSTARRGPGGRPARTPRRATHRQPDRCRGRRDRGGRRPPGRRRHTGPRRAAARRRRVVGGRRALPAGR